MALNYVTLTLDLYDGTGNLISAGTATFTPTVQLTDTTDHELIPPAPVTVSFKPTGSPVVKLLATDNATVLPSGWNWSVSFSGVPGSPASFTFALPYASGADQYLSAQAPTSTAVTSYPDWPGTTLGDTVYGGSSPAGTPTRLAGNTSATKEFLTQTGDGTNSAAPAWGTIASADLPAGTTSAKGALQLDGTAADIAMDGTQAAGSTGKAADAGHVHPSDTSRLAAASNLSDLASASTARGNLGLGTAAVAAIDTTASDIAALGTQAAGSTGKVADAGHVHPATGMLTKVADTGSGGFALQNGTPTILSWTAPSDGALHTAYLSAAVDVTSAETGGNLVYGASGDYTKFAVGGGLSAQWVVFSLSAPVKPGQTFTLSQSVALTGGAATVYAQIWAA